MDFPELEGTFARQLTLEREKVATLEADKAALTRHGLETLEQWRLCGEAQGILSGWLGLTYDPEHLALLRRNTEAFLAKCGGLS